MGRRQEHPYFGKPRKSTYRGVSWAKWDAKWQAKITIDGKQRLLGLFDNEIDAAHARESAEAEYRRAADARVCIDREETAAAIFNAIQAAEHSSEHWKTFSPTQKAAQVAALIRQRPAVRPSVSPDTEAQARTLIEDWESTWDVTMESPAERLDLIGRIAALQSRSDYSAELSRLERTMKQWEESYLAEHATWGHCTNYSAAVRDAIEKVKAATIVHGPACGEAAHCTCGAQAVRNKLLKSIESLSPVTTKGSDDADN